MGPHNRMAVTEKVDLGASLKKISAYMRGDLALMITALVLAAFGAVLTIVGPDKIGEMTNLMAEGFASGIDMAAVATCNGIQRASSLEVRRGAQLG